jgi:hypothetical protein
VERRAALQLLTVLGIGAAAPAAALEPTRSRIDHALGTRPYTVAEWEHLAYQYGHTIRTEPATRIAADLASDLNALHHSLRTTGHGDLAAVTARMSAYMAMTLFSLGELRGALRWWRTARNAADTTGDTALRTWIRAREAGQALYTGTPPHAAFQTAAEAIALAGESPCAGVAEAHAVRAAILAAADDTSGARQALQDLHAVYGKLPDSVTNDRLSVWGWGPTKLAHNQANVLTLLRDVPAAISAIDQAVGMFPAALRRSTAQVELDRAECMIASGHVDDGLDHAVTSISALGPRHHTYILGQVVNRVLDALPDNHARTLPAAEHLKELVAGNRS